MCIEIQLGALWHVPAGFFIPTNWHSLLESLAKAVQKYCEVKNIKGVSHLLHCDCTELNPIFRQIWADLLLSWHHPCCFCKSSNRNTISCSHYTVSLSQKSWTRAHTKKACWRGNKLHSHQIVHDSKQLLFHLCNFSGKEAWFELGTCATAAACWLELRASQNDRCSPEVLIWTAASEAAGDWWG